MKDLAGNELEVRWTKLEDAVPGTLLLDFYTGGLRIHWGSSLDLMTDGRRMFSRWKGQRPGAWCDSGIRTKAYPIDDRNGPILLST